MPSFDIFNMNILFFYFAYLKNYNINFSAATRSRSMLPVAMRR